jgi:hypothetical protein
MEVATVSGQSFESRQMKLIVLKKKSFEPPVHTYILQASAKRD